MENVVMTESGKVQGIKTGDVLQFHGIPYAKPPVGARRFLPPEPASAWEGVYDATFRHPMPPQKPSDLDIPMGLMHLGQSEDCLTLSVSTPDTEGKLPVAVWLHGGANCYGGGDVEWYDEAILASKGNLVCVNLNFRLGVFGFLQYPGVNDKNLCIEDQILALQWIQRNISRFGGDPDRVTVFGQSAGANSILHMLARDDTDGLFSQAILESPSIGRGNHLQDDAFRVGKALLEELGIDPQAPSEQLNRELREKRVEEILKAGENIRSTIGKEFQGMYFKPVKDEWHTPEQTALAAAEGAGRRKVKIVIGFTKDEMYAFVPGRTPDMEQSLREAQKLRYEAPGYFLADAASRLGCTVYCYRFDWRAPESEFGACHCIELPFVFGNLDAWDAPMLKGASKTEMERLSVEMQGLWCQFFRFETPGEDVWPEYKQDLPAVKCFDNGQNPVVHKRMG